MLSLITPWFGRQVLTWIVDMASIGAAIGFLYTTLSAFKLVRKEKGQVIIKLFSLIGIVLSLGFVLLLIVLGMSSYLTFPSRVALFIWIGLGVLFYAISAKGYNSVSDKELSDLIGNKVKN